jgi:hypothetical protein
LGSVHFLVFTYNGKVEVVSHTATASSF